jgi:iron complex transport system substrate-binding protein
MQMAVKALVIATTTLALLTGCTSQPGSVTTITSAKSITVESPASLPKLRIVALANGSAEIIASLGLKQLLVGRDIASTSAELKEVPIATAGHQVVTEKILELKPDLLLIDNTTGPATALDLIKGLGIKVVMIQEAWTLSEILRKIREVAAAVSAESSAQALESEMETALAKSGSNHRGVRIAFLYLRGGSAIYLLGGKGSGADSLIAHLGATDVGAEMNQQPFSPITSETLIAANPDVILVMRKGLQSVGGVAGLVELPGISQTSAGKNRAVVAVDDSLLLSFGPRTPDLLQQLSAAISQVMRA